MNQENKKIISKSRRVAWQKVKIQSAIPKKRKSHTAVVHKNRLYVYAGYHGSHAGDVWIFYPDGSRWKRADIQGQVPVKRTGHSAAIWRDNMV
jgi:hypothetical protein